MKRLDNRQNKLYIKSPKPGQQERFFGKGKLSGWFGERHISRGRLRGKRAWLEK